MSSASATHLRDCRNWTWMLPSPSGTWGNFLNVSSFEECVAAIPIHVSFQVLGDKTTSADVLLLFLALSAVGWVMLESQVFLPSLFGWSIELINPNYKVPPAARLKVVTKPTQRGGVWGVTPLCFWLRLLPIIRLKLLQGMSTGYLFCSRAFDQLLHSLK